MINATVNETLQDSPNVERGKQYSHIHKEFRDNCDGVYNLTHINFTSFIGTLLWTYDFQPLGSKIIPNDKVDSLRWNARYKPMGRT